ncbi:MAG: DUF975 family protein [Oscillospiraceae bacterium]|nr:DUF975 family protein [Oscillospiraceae bacterium]
MWTRSELKNRAKLTLKGHYWTAFVASLVLGIANGGSGGSSLTAQLEERMLDGQSPEYVIGFAVGAIIAALLALAVAIFVGGPLEVGVRRYFTSACCRQYDLGNLGFAFREGRYWNAVKTQVLCAVEIFLWSLLLVIPGIIKGYAYTFVPYILADNPHISPKRALQLSNQMTMGHKFEIFVLGLSFIGWYLLGTLACGVGVIFVTPYYESTMAELYMQLRHNALQNGTTTMEELCLVYN